MPLDEDPPISQGAEPEPPSADAVRAAVGQIVASSGLRRLRPGAALPALRRRGDALRPFRADQGILGRGGGLRPGRVLRPAERPGCAHRGRTPSPGARALLPPVRQGRPRSSSISQGRIRSDLHARPQAPEAPPPPVAAVSVARPGRPGPTRGAARRGSRWRRSWWSRSPASRPGTRSVCRDSTPPAPGRCRQSADPRPAVHRSWRRRGIGPLFGGAHRRGRHRARTASRKSRCLASRPRDRCRPTRTCEAKRRSRRSIRARGQRARQRGHRARRRAGARAPRTGRCCGRGPMRHAVDRQRSVRDPGKDRRRGGGGDRAALRHRLPGRDGAASRRRPRTTSTPISAR